MEEIKYKFFITYNGNTIEVFPLNTNNLQIVWDKEDERYFLTDKLKGSLKFVGAEYEFLHAIEQDPETRCSEVIIDIHKLCNGVYESLIMSNLFLNKGFWNEDQCFVEIEPDVINSYNCWDNKAEEEINVSALELTRVVAKVVDETSEVERLGCSGPLPLTYCGIGDFPSDGAYKMYWYWTRDYDDDSRDVTDVRYYREKYTGAGVPASGQGWVLIGTDYYRMPFIADYTLNENTLGFSSSGVQEYLSTILNGSVVKQIPNGVRLKELLEKLLFKACPNLTLKSDFFQFNPAIVSNINYVTGQLSEILNLMVFQKSDVKRPNVSGQSTAGKVNLKRIIIDLCSFFNLKWYIDEDADLFVIEHYSFFESMPIKDMLSRSDSYLRSGMNKYSYMLDYLPKKEMFQMPDATPSQAYPFSNYEILYNNNCAGQGDQKEIIYSSEILMTDVNSCFDSGLKYINYVTGGVIVVDKSVISDEGFVLVACDQNDYITSEFINNNTSERDANYVLSWQNLINKYWSYGRPFKHYEVDLTERTANSVIKSKKQEDIKYIMCCEEIDVNGRFQTEMGVGILETATFDLFTETLTVNFLYE